MTKSQLLFDKIAVSLSFLCALHCLVLPFVLVVLPSIAALNLHGEEFHLWMVLAVIPISIYALTLGCKQHKRNHLFAIGAIGLALLLAAVFLGHALLGEYGEKILTLLGASLIAFGHIKNYRLCQQHKSCCCPEEAVLQPKRSAEA